MSPALQWRAGFEVELIAPRGLSRASLAEELARRCGGRTEPVWHQDAEPSLVPGLGHFRHLTRGFRVARPGGGELCRLVDDVTLVTDLDARATPAPGWYRVLTDDTRLLKLLASQIDPATPLERALDRPAALWGVAVQHLGDIARLDDPTGATVALAAPQGGERERGCEIVTPPLETDHEFALEELLEPARRLGFAVPREAAVHVHFDAAPLRPAPVLANVVRLFGWWREALHALLGTNPACRRLAPLPAELVAAVAGEPSYDELRAAAAGRVTKFADANLLAFFAERPLRDTLEVRILPGAIDTGPIVAGAATVEALLTRCLNPAPIPAPPADPAAAVPALRELADGGHHHRTLGDAPVRSTTGLAQIKPATPPKNSIAPIAIPTPPP